MAPAAAEGVAEGRADGVVLVAAVPTVLDRGPPAVLLLVTLRRRLAAAAVAPVARLAAVAEAPPMDGRAEEVVAGFLTGDVVLEGVAREVPVVDPLEGADGRGAVVVREVADETGGRAEPATEGRPAVAVPRAAPVPAVTREAGVVPAAGADGRAAVRVAPVVLAPGPMLRLRADPAALGLAVVLATPGRAAPAAAAVVGVLPGGTVV